MWSRTGGESLCEKSRNGLEGVPASESSHFAEDSSILSYPIKSPSLLSVETSSGSLGSIAKIELLLRRQYHKQARRWFAKWERPCVTPEAGEPCSIRGGL
jgi:hypothetical protein